MRYSRHICSAGIVVLALTVGLCSSSEAQRGGGRDEARRQCETGDSNQRLAGCTIVINAKGFGSKFELATALDARCRAFNDLQQYERALADCKASVALQPSYSYAHLNLGTSLVGLGDLPNGIAEFTKAIELKSNLIYSYLGRAKAFAALGNKELAKKDFKQALTIDPTSREAREGMADLDNPPATAGNEPQPKPTPPSQAIAEAPILRSLPSDVQKEIEQVRQSCREIGSSTVAEGDSR